jgi:hypothetical protein
MENQKKYQVWKKLKFYFNELVNFSSNLPEKILFSVLFRLLGSYVKLFSIGG